MPPKHETESVEISAGLKGITIKGVGSKAFRPVLMICVMVAAGAGVYGSVGITNVHSDLNSLIKKMDNHEERLQRIEKKLGLSFKVESETLSGEPFYSVK